MPERQVHEHTGNRSGAQRLSTAYPNVMHVWEPKRMDSAFVGLEGLHEVLVIF